MTRLHCGGDKSLLIISYANFLTVFRQFLDDSKYLSSCHKEVITARICSLKGDAHVVQIAIATGFLHVVLPLTVTIYTLRFSVFTSVHLKFSSFFFFFFFWLFCFYFRKRKSAKIYEKYLFLVFLGATDRNFTEKYSIVITYMFMTNDRCEDSFL